MAKNWHYQAGHGRDPGFFAGAADIFGTLAEFERDIIRERVLAVLHAARTRGRMEGRKPGLNAEEVEIVKKLYALRRQQTDLKARSPKGTG